jgi:hypothetical protein
MGSPDENRLKSGSKRGTGGLTGPFFAVRMKKSGRGGLCGETSGDALRLLLNSIEPITEHIGNISRRRNIKSKVNNSPNKTSKGTCKKEMVNRLL